MTKIITTFFIILLLATPSYSNDEEFNDFKELVYQLGMFNLIELKFQYKLVGVLLGYNCINIQNISDHKQCNYSNTTQSYINTLKNGTPNEITTHLGFENQLKWNAIIETITNHGLKSFLTNDKFKSIGEIPDSIKFAYNCNNDQLNENQCVDLLITEMNIEMVERIITSLNTKKI